MARFNQIVLLVGLLGVSWPLMMLVHESGHMLAAVVTGGHVQQLVWYPTVLSRTDVNPNPSPLVVVWGGPLFGAVVPVLGATAVRATKWSISYLVMFFAGFCLLANGAYIGVGTFERVGDAKDMLHFGTPPSVMLAFGLIGTVSGLWLINRVSPRLGFGNRPVAMRADHAYGVLLIALALMVIGFVFGRAN